MYSKTQWFIKAGTVGLVLAWTVAPAAGQRIDVPAARFAFSPELDAARDLFNAGVDLFDGGSFPEAEKKFREVVKRFKTNPIADKSNYYLIRALSRQRKVDEALKEISAFEKTYPRSSWLTDVREERIRLTNEVPHDLMVVMAPPPPPAPPAPPVPPQAPTPPARAPSFGISARAPRAEENPVVSLQQEVLRVLFESNADRAIEIAAERLKADPADPVVLSSLYMVANSRSDKALPMLVTVARTSPQPRTRMEALMWISRSRGDKDAIADLLVSLVPSMSADEDSAALANVLGQMNNAKALDALATMARDKSKSEKLRLNAIQAIGDARLANRVALLDDIYKSSMDNTRIRRQVINFLTHARDPQVVDVLARAAANDPDITVRREAVIGLGQVKSPEALKALENLLNKKP